MKKLPSLIIILTLIANFGWTQTSKKAEKIGRVWVENAGASSIQVKCERFEGFLADSSVNYFCWDACYAPSVSISVGSLPIAALDTNKFFYGDYNPGGGTGTSTIKYCFYIDGVPEDSACFTFLFDENSPADSLYGTVSISPTVGIEFIGATNRNEILEIHPNPAKNIAAVNYSLKHNTERGALIVRNVLGSEIYKVDLMGRAGQARPSGYAFR